jgi:outer membrane protein
MKTIKNIIVFHDARFAEILLNTIFNRSNQPDMLKQNKRKILITILSSFVLTFTASSEPMRLSLDNARNYAIEHNRHLLNAGLAIDEAGQMLRETIAQGLPQVNATVDYNNFFGSTASLGAFPGMEITFNPTSNASLTVGQLLFNASYIVGIQTARLFRDVTGISRERTELEIVSQVMQAYYLVLVSEQSRDILRANISNMEDLLNKTSAMVNAGIAEELDYDQLSIQARMLENGLTAAQRQVEMAFNMLRLQMGIEAGAEIILTDDLESIVTRSDFQGSLLTGFALNENVDYRLMELQTSIAERQVDMERAAYLPTIAGFYNYTEKLLKPEFDITPKHVIGLNVNIPIFSSGARRARVNQARIGLESVVNQQELLSDQLMIQERQLRFNLNNAIEQYESQKSNVEVAKRVYSNMSLKYEHGLVSSLDLTTANNNYLQAENSYISALLQLLNAQVEIDRLLNKI